MEKGSANYLLVTPLLDCSLGTQSFIRADLFEIKPFLLLGSLFIYELCIFLIDSLVKVASWNTDLLMNMFLIPEQSPPKHK